MADVEKVITGLEQFIAELCDELGVSMDSVAMYNIDKLKRRYPSGFDAERSLHREV